MLRDQGAPGLDTSELGCSGTGILRDLEALWVGCFRTGMLRDRDPPGPGCSRTGLLRDQDAPWVGCSGGWGVLKGGRMLRDPAREEAGDAQEGVGVVGTENKAESGELRCSEPAPVLPPLLCR